MSLVHFIPGNIQKVTGSQVTCERNRICPFKDRLQRWGQILWLLLYRVIFGLYVFMYYLFASSQSSANIFGSSVSMFSFENWQVPTFLCPPPLYFNIRLPTFTSEVRFIML